MAYLIDGHNLIPKVSGLSLADPDDETRLIEMVQRLCQRQRKRAEVFFDQAPPGLAGSRRLGWVLVHFVRQGLTADEAIARRLKTLGGEARNWTVVSSDHRVQAEARARGARVVSAEDFARWLLADKLSAPTKPAPEEAPLSPEEVDYWLRLFGEGKQNRGSSSSRQKK
ncbi:NYN domain-containing protein [uncultured Thermanaerothrix sp.]|uniref:NYN domain-containing protein n=1 Tax=uncultured Thermanaerothrix sp. TaxID=1195149 RepID=UPI002616570B|nr:NYN domain-containing protein [uncultured Thermanaerothrix sp.]